MMSHYFKRLFLVPFVACLNAIKEEKGTEQEKIATDSNVLLEKQSSLLICVLEFGYDFSCLSEFMSLSVPSLATL